MPTQEIHRMLARLAERRSGWHNYSSFGSGIAEDFHYVLLRVPSETDGV